jgi:hypothetical protein
LSLMLSFSSKFTNVIWFLAWSKLIFLVTFTVLSDFGMAKVISPFVIYRLFSFAGTILIGALKWFVFSSTSGYWTNS